MQKRNLVIIDYGEGHYHGRYYVRLGAKYLLFEPTTVVGDDPHEIITAVLDWLCEQDKASVEGRRMERSKEWDNYANLP